MKGRNVAWLVALAFFLSMAFALVARGEDDARDYQEESRYGVARISLIHGDVTMMRGDTQDWVAANINMPLVRGDRIYAGDRSRTEIEIDFANVLRLAERTEVKLADIARTRIQVQISRGLATYNVLRGSEADVEMDTPNVAVRPLKEGIYRVEVTDSGNTIVTVRKGEAEVSTPQGSVVVKKGRQINVVGLDSPQYQVVEAAHKDDWDRFNEQRNDEIYDARSYRYVSRSIYGVDDLDHYGRWVWVADYGYCWYPFGVVHGWVPYRYGYWSWIPYWGWTWVSYEPWGWAPYHYGRWFYYGSYGWMWYPGLQHQRHWWAPAHVAFFGFGGQGWSVGVGFNWGHSHLGWVPLAPRDRFWPWWGGHRVTNVVNITNITNVTKVTNVRNVTNVNNIFVNKHAREAITTASADDFARGHVPREQRPVDIATLQKANLVQGNPPVLPNRDIVRANERTLAPTAVPPARFTRENFFTKQKPPAGPARFDDQVENLRERLTKQGFAGLPGGKAEQKAVGGAGVETPGNVNRARERAVTAEPADRPNLQRAPVGGSRPMPKAVEVPERSSGAQAEGRKQAEEQLQQGGSSGSGVRTTGPMINKPVQHEGETVRPAEKDRSREAGPSELKPGFSRFGSSRSTESPQVGNEGSPRAESPLSGSAQEKEKPKAKPTPQQRPAVDQQRPVEKPRPGFQRFERQQPSGEAQGKPTETPRQEFRRFEAQQPATSPSIPRSESQGKPAEVQRPQSGFQRFEAQPRRESEMRIQGGEPARPAGQARPSAGQERRTEFSRESPRRSEAPPQAERRQLEIRKPITVERQSRSERPAASRSERQSSSPRPSQSKPQGQKPH